MFIKKQELEEIIRRLNDLENILMVRDEIIYIEQSIIKLIPRSNAIKFQRANRFFDGYENIICYTTKENYDNHKPLIDKWKEELNNLKE